jgi:hypothetical protein
MTSLLNGLLQINGQRDILSARFEIFTARLLKIEVYWDVTLCRYVSSYLLTYRQNVAS